MPGPAPTVLSVFRELARHPWTHLVRRWNWKSAVTSAILRAAIFFAVNLAAGPREAAGAMLAEFSYRVVISGFYGAVTQAFRRAEPAWAAFTVAMIVLPATSHLLEFTVHWLRGTPKLAASIIASICFTGISTVFNLYAMRRGVLVVGEERRSLWQDLRAMPRIIAGFLTEGPVRVWRLARGRGGDGA